MAIGCGGDDAPTDAGVDAPMSDGAVDSDTPRPSHLFRIESSAEYDSLASEAAEVKFLIEAPDGSLPGPLAEEPVVFSDTERYPFHLRFLRSQEGLEMLTQQAYTDAIRLRESRVYAPGSLFWYPHAPHPDGSVGVVAYTLSIEEDEAPDSPAAWAFYDTIVSERVSMLPSDVVLIATTPRQEVALLAQREALAVEGVTVMRRSDLLTTVIEVYSPGETYGYVHILPEGTEVEEYGPRDIVIADAAREDISILSGLITTFPQSSGSHLNLRMREKGLPNLRWVSVRQSREVEALRGQLAHLVVTADGNLTIEAASLEDAERFWRMQQPPLGAPDSDLVVTDFRPFADLSHPDGEAFGVKAANLGELYDALPPDHRATGFAIPFAEYAAHIAENDLMAEIDSVLNDPTLDESRDRRHTRLNGLRRAIRNAPLRDGLLPRLETAIVDTFGEAGRTTFLRFRSSTNAEDLQEFSGAGLYDSRTGCLADDLDGDEVGPSRCWTEADLDEVRRRIAALEERLRADPSLRWIEAEIEDLQEDLMEEKPVADALRKVWRSLWNPRAYEERAYYGVTHRAVFMGVAVMPSFVFERQESVVLTNLPSQSDGGSRPTGLYRVVSQTSDIGVVRPTDPRARAEEMTFVRNGDEAQDFMVLTRSSESPDADLWQGEARVELTQLLFTAADHFETIYPEIDPLRLDMEIEVTRDGFTVIKQVRPYLGVVDEGE